MTRQIYLCRRFASLHFKSPLYRERSVGYNTPSVYRSFAQTPTEAWYHSKARPRIRGLSCRDRLLRLSAEAYWLSQRSLRRPNLSRYARDILSNLEFLIFFSAAIRKILLESCQYQGLTLTSCYRASQTRWYFYLLHHPLFNRYQQQNSHPRNPSPGVLGPVLIRESPPSFLFLTVAAEGAAPPPPSF